MSHQEISQHRLEYTAPGARPRRSRAAFVGEPRDPSTEPDAVYPGESGSGLESRTLLAACRGAWHEPLLREARTTLGAEVYAFEDALALVCAACEILARGSSIELVVLESRHEHALGFLRNVAPEVPVILVGARDDLQARIRAATGGAAAFLAEPVTMLEIVRVGRALVRAEASGVRRGEIPIPLHLLGEASR